VVENIPKIPGLVIAYHGCDKSVADKVVSGEERLKGSTNSYDWLGPGQYFWEDSVQRALDWAIDNSQKEDSEIQEPAVLGAVIDMGICLNLVDTYSINLVKEAFENLKTHYELVELPLPQNKNTKGNNDWLMRHLDCAVIKFLCTYHKNIDTIRGVFLEGKELYEGAGFRDKTHIQICVRNSACIKGYFLPIVKI